MRLAPHPVTDLGADIDELVPRLREGEEIAVSAPDDGRFLAIRRGGPGMVRARIACDELVTPVDLLTKAGVNVLLDDGWVEQSPRDGLRTFRVDAEVHWSGFLADMVVRVVEDVWGLRCSDVVLDDGRASRGCLVTVDDEYIPIERLLP